MADGEIHVSIVMPCLNEATTLAACIKRAHEALAILRKRHGLAGEVVVADNGSTDDSREIALQHGARVVRVAKRGYGAAVAAGFRGARGRFLVMSDCDGSYDFVEAVPMVERLMAGADLCMGSRFAGEIKPGAMPWKNRYIGNPVLSATLRILFRTRVQDSHCGLRALTRACFERLRLTSSGMEFASEMVLKAALLEMKIAETPVTLSPDGRDRPPHLRPWSDGWRHLRYMLMLSPGGLFFLPAALLALIGTFLLAALLTQPDSMMVSLGPFQIGDHWLVLANAMVLLAVQIALSGVAALVYGFREGYRKRLGFGYRTLRRLRLEHWVLSGLGIGLVGVIWVSVIVGRWAGSDFGALSAVRELSVASMLTILGAQLLFGGFLLSIVAGNQSDLVPGPDGTEADASPALPATGAEAAGVDSAGADTDARHRV